MGAPWQRALIVLELDLVAQLRLLLAQLRGNRLPGVDRLRPARISAVCHARIAPDAAAAALLVGVGAGRGRGGRRGRAGRARAHLLELPLLLILHPLVALKLLPV